MASKALHRSLCPQHNRLHTAAMKDSATSKALVDLCFEGSASHIQGIFLIVSPTVHSTAQCVGKVGPAQTVFMLLN